MVALAGHWSAACRVTEFASTADSPNYAEHYKDLEGLLRRLDAAILQPVSLNARNGRNGKSATVAAQSDGRYGG